MQAIISIIKALLKVQTLPYWATMIISIILNALGLPVPTDMVGLAGGGLNIHTRWLKFKRRKDPATVAVDDALKQSGQDNINIAYKLQQWLEGKTPLQSGAVVIGLATTLVAGVSIVMYYTTGHALNLPTWFYPVMLAMGFQLNWTATKPIATKKDEE